MRWVITRSVKLACTERAVEQAVTATKQRKHAGSRESDGRVLAGFQEWSEEQGQETNQQEQEANERETGRQ